MTKTDSGVTGDSAATTDRDTADRLGTEICALAGHIAAATSRFLALVARFDETRGWTGPGLHSCAHWLSWKCGLSPHTGREYVRVAKALTTLPTMRAALKKVACLTPTSAPAGQIDRLVAGLRKATNDDQGKPKLDRFETRWHWDSNTGDFVFRGRLAAQDGAKVLAALTNSERERTSTTEVHALPGSAYPHHQCNTDDGADVPRRVLPHTRMWTNAVSACTSRSVLACWW